MGSIRRTSKRQNCVCSDYWISIEELFHEVSSASQRITSSRKPLGEGFSGPTTHQQLSLISRFERGIKPE